MEHPGATAGRGTNARDLGPFHSIRQLVLGVVVHAWLLATCDSSGHIDLGQLPSTTTAQLHPTAIQEKGLLKFTTGKALNQVLATLLAEPIDVDSYQHPENFSMTEATLRHRRNVMATCAAVYVVAASRGESFKVLSNDVSQDFALVVGFISLVYFTISFTLAAFTEKARVDNRLLVAREQHDFIVDAIRTLRDLVASNHLPANNEVLQRWLDNVSKLTTPVARQLKLLSVRRSLDYVFPLLFSVLTSVALAAHGSGFIDLSATLNFSQTGAGAALSASPSPQPDAGVQSPPSDEGN